MPQFIGVVTGAAVSEDAFCCLYALMGSQHPLDMADCPATNDVRSSVNDSRDRHRRLTLVGLRPNGIKKHVVVRLLAIVSSEMKKSWRATPQFASRLGR
jgi:hypothetical protein